jgi:hypothetical protein
VTTECDTVAETEGGRGGRCVAIEDEVQLENRESGERSVTGRGPHIDLSIPTTKSRGKKIKLRHIFVSAWVSVGLPSCLDRALAHRTCGFLAY